MQYWQKLDTKIDKVATGLTLLRTDQKKVPNRVKQEELEIATLKPQADHMQLHLIKLAKRVSSWNTDSRMQKGEQEGITLG